MNFDEIVVKESPGLCRCCLSEGCYKDLSTEYTWMNDTEVYADMLLECFDISISQHNDGPNGGNRLICEVCITRLRDACNFKKQVLDSEKKFVDLLARGEFQPKVIMYQAPMKSEQLLEESVVEDAEVEYLDESMDYDDDLPLKQPAESAETYDGDAVINVREVKVKRGRPKKSTTVVKTVKTEKKKAVKKPAAAKKPLNKDEYPPGPYDGYTTARRRKNLQILFNNTTIMPFKWRGRHLCFYCGKSSIDYTELKKHTKSHGACTTKDYALKIIKGNHIEIKIDVTDISCEVCNEPFGSFDEIVDHLIGKHKLEYDKSIDIPFQEYRLSDCQCLFCGQQFTYFGNLVSHVNMNHPQNCFICDDCGATFNKKRDLSVHLRNNHRQGGYPCDQCSKVFDTKKILISHQNNYHFRKCKTCNASFASLGLLKKHVQCEHPDDGCLKCNYCSKELNSKQGLKQHLNKCKVKMLSPDNVPTDDCNIVDNIEPRKRQNVLQIRKNILCILNMSTAVPFRFLSKFSCFYCSKKFVDFDELREHTNLEHPTYDLKSKCIKKCKGERTSVKIDINNLICKLCCEPMADLDVLIDHLIENHKANYDKSVVRCLDPFRVIKDNLPCPLCPKTFRYFVILLRHMNSEHNDNKNICNFCGRSFKNVANLNVHISYSHADTVECDICLAKFKNQWCLSRHKAKTHDAKDFKCPKCPEMFQSHYHKQKHLIKVHNVGHKCSYCGRMFTRNSFMKDHIRRTHLKEKNVPCSVCNEKFFDNNLLKMHMVKHEGDRKFNCSVCNKAFLRRSNLYSHMEMHKKYGHVSVPE